MKKKSFIDAIDMLFAENDVPQEAIEYFTKTYKTPGGAKADGRAETIKTGILTVLEKSGDKKLSRNQIAQKLVDIIDERLIRNEKGHLAYNSITFIANKLVADGTLERQEVREGKSKCVKYCLKQAV